MNKGGTRLDTFDILVAKFAEVGKEKTLYNILVDTIDCSYEVPRALSQKDASISQSLLDFDTLKKDFIVKPIKEQYLNLIALFSAINRSGINELTVNHIKKHYLLKLKQDQIDTALPHANKALHRSLLFLQFRCGFDSFNRLNYKLMLLPIAIMLERDEIWENKSKVDIIEFWFWASLFSGRYRERQNNRVIDDILKLDKLVRGEQGGEEIISRKENLFNETSYNDLKTLLHLDAEEPCPAAIQTGLLLFVLSRQPSDFTTEDRKLIAWELRSRSEKIILEDHHIIPIASAKNIGDSAKKIRKEKKATLINSPLNRVLISEKANRDIGGMLFETYSKKLNEAAARTQFIPNRRNTDVSSIAQDEEELESFLRDRFDLVQREIKNHLDRLIR